MVDKIKSSSQKEKGSVTSTEELKKQISKVQEEYLSLQLEHEQRKLKNTSSLTLKRKELARFLTALRIIELTK